MLDGLLQTYYMLLVLAVVPLCCWIDAVRRGEVVEARRAAAVAMCMLFAPIAVPLLLLWMCWRAMRWLPSAVRFTITSHSDRTTCPDKDAAYLREAEAEVEAILRGDA